MSTKHGPTWSMAGFPQNVSIALVVLCQKVPVGKMKSSEPGYRHGFVAGIV